MSSRDEDDKEGMLGKGCLVGRTGNVCLPSSTMPRRISGSY